MEASNQAVIDELTQEIYDLAGMEFNINSPKQLGELLFDKMQLPTSYTKKTKTGYSTAVDVLERLAPISPIVSKILEYRQIAKLQSTYIVGLQDFILQDGKIHTRYLQDLTQTGRLSSVDPNLQNIPVRLEQGRLIRKAFVPETEDEVLLSSDYSQIELRVLAHISNDEHLIAAFREGADIHTSTAMRVFGIEKQKMSHQMTVVMLRLLTLVLFTAFRIMGLLITSAFHVKWLNNTLKRILNAIQALKITWSAWCVMPKTKVMSKRFSTVAESCQILIHVISIFVNLQNAQLSTHQSKVVQLIFSKLP